MSLFSVSLSAYACGSCPIIHIVGVQRTNCHDRNKWIDVPWNDHPMGQVRVINFLMTTHVSIDLFAVAPRIFGSTHQTLLIIRSYYQAAAMCSRCYSIKARGHMHTRASSHEHNSGHMKRTHGVIDTPQLPHKYAQHVLKKNAQHTVLAWWLVKQFNKRNSVRNYFLLIYAGRIMVKSHRRCSRTVGLRGPWPQAWVFFWPQAWVNRVVGLRR
jgi:hypothetical protein